MKKLYGKLMTILSGISSLQIAVYSGNAAFFLLLSVLPAVMLLLTAVQLLPVSAKDLFLFLSGLLPTPAVKLLEAVLADLEPGKAIAVLSATFFGTAWSLTRSMGSLMKGLDAVYGIRESRSLLRKWAISLFCAVLFLLSIVATLLLQVFGRSIHAFAQSRRWPIAALLAAVLHLRWFFSIGFLTLVFSLFYTLLPAVRLNFLQNLPGALLTAVGWLVYSAFFGIYVEHFSSYSMIYGSLTAAVVTVLWLYFCINLLFYGGLFNRFLNSSEHPFQTLFLFFRQ